MRAKLILEESKLRFILGLPDDTSIDFVEASADPIYVSVGVSGPSVEKALRLEDDAYSRHHSFVENTQMLNSERPIIRSSTSFHPEQNATNG